MQVPLPYEVDLHLRFDPNQKDLLDVKNASFISIVATKTFDDLNTSLIIVPTRKLALLQLMHSIKPELTIGFRLNYDYDSGGRRWAHVGHYSHDCWKAYWQIYPHLRKEMRFGLTNQTRETLVTGLEIIYDLKKDR